jgi:hypothetical protein
MILQYIASAMREAAEVSLCIDAYMRGRRIRLRDSAAIVLLLAPDESFTRSELLEKYPWISANLNHPFNILVDRGLLSRMPATDRRTRPMVLTDSGRQLRDDLIAVLQERYDKSLRGGGENAENGRWPASQGNRQGYQSGRSGGHEF